LATSSRIEDGYWISETGSFVTESGILGSWMLGHPVVRFFARQVMKIIVA
jgi:hypothetical protein